MPSRTSKPVPETKSSGGGDPVPNSEAAQERRRCNLVHLDVDKCPQSVRTRLELHRQAVLFGIRLLAHEPPSSEVHNLGVPRHEVHYCCNLLTDPEAHPTRNFRYDLVGQHVHTVRAPVQPLVELHGDPALHEGAHDDAGRKAATTAAASSPARNSFVDATSSQGAKPPGRAAGASSSSSRRRSSSTEATASRNDFSMADVAGNLKGSRSPHPPPAGQRATPDVSACVRSQPCKQERQNVLPQQFNVTGSRTISVQSPHSKSLKSQPTAARFPLAGVPA
eukprot:CAMPEP_0177507864 /NCGR_PEP_ID=MMETSP0369-20130122/40717_1 /TAXON_ID=447022 ORGANISM="Scrippsiella hangoei-like, Strain SHHI-4" /NCGR_SAMPLE_ID=MMETSP0369 /ASSEMBLY_ACC=CAM_ASM_000364 /LENGTH=278 /DNA_ID=CAMNT_0018985929 /DNA_START=138 /DNA_END=970 /DNA_ORIENTATION=+